MPIGYLGNFSEELRDLHFVVGLNEEKIAKHLSGMLRKWETSKVAPSQGEGYLLRSIVTKHATANWSLHGCGIQNFMEFGSVLELYHSQIINPKSRNYVGMN